MDLVWNASSADEIERQSREAMNRQIANMDATVKGYRRIADSLERPAADQEHIARTAMKTVFSWCSVSGEQTSSWVPDWDARERARNRAADLRLQQFDLRTAAANLEHAAIDLRDAITDTKRLFDSLCYRLSSEDRTFSTHVDQVTNDIVAFTRKMEHIRDSFDNCFPLLSMIHSINRLNDVSEAEILDAFLAAALAGFPLFTMLAGDPVNMSTGNFIYSKKDIEIPGRYPLVFERFYNTIGGKREGALGSDWTHNFNIQLNFKEETAYVSFGNGQTETYKEMGNGFYICVLASDKVLKKTDDGWVMRSPLMETYFFDNEGLILCKTDINGDSFDFCHTDGLLTRVSTFSGGFSFAYDDKRQLTTVTDHNGRNVNFEYTNDRLTKVTYPCGATNSYVYDSNGRLIELFDALGERETKTEFDKNNRATKQYLTDGSVIEYIYDDDKKITTYVQQNGSKIHYRRDEKYRTTEVIYPDGSEKFEYDNNNLKTLYVDKLGNKTAYTYNDAMKVASITDAMGYKTEVNYSPLNQISSVILDGQVKYHNHYDEDGNLVAIEDALQHETKFSYVQKGVPETIIQPDGSRIQFAYDERRNITQITDATGITTQYLYDNLNRIIETVDGNGNKQRYQYDIAGNIIEVKNANGDVRNYVYNAANKVTGITDFNGTSMRREYNSLNKPSKLVDQLGRETLLNYDNMWNLAHVVQPNGAETKFMYNALNRLESIVKPDGSTVSYQYDANGNRTGVKDELGNQTYLKYDALGRLIEVTGEDDLQFSYSYNSSGQLTSAADGLGNTVNLIYNAAGQIIQETNAMGETRKYTYTPLGKIASATDESGRTTTYDYEPGGRLFAAYYPDNTKDIYSYDKGGNIKSSTDRFGQTRTFDYDCLNRVVKITDSTGAAKHYSYDAIGNVTAMTDEQGNTTSYEYTLTGQLSKVIDALGNEAIYTYDECDRLIEICQSTDLGFDEDLRFATERNEENRQLRVMRYERNILGQVEAITDALGNRESYGYDARGQLIEKLDKDGYLTKYGYTAHGEVNHIQYADGREVKLSYNPLRQLTEMEDWLGITKIEVDALGRATKVTNHQNKEVSYAYNSAGLKTAITYPDGRQVSYDYDELLRLQSVNDGLNKTTYSYDEFSRLTEKVFSNGTKTQFLYNDMNRLQELSHWNSDGLLDKFQYEYDILGNKTAITKQRRELPEESGVYSYAYDALNRLQSVQKDGELLRRYEYDEFGNRLKMSAGEGQISYTYNAMNQLISTADTAGDEQRYIYDKRGNLTEIHKNGVLLNQFQFGALNRLEKAINLDGELNSEYRYNGLGHRVGQSIGSDLNPMKQIDDVLDLTRNINNLLERREDGTATSYIWDSSLLSATGVDGVKNYLLDEQGGISRLVGVDGTAELYGYDEFGNMQHGTPSLAQPFGFTGYQHDPIAGTWFAQSREYDAKTGRFTAKDLNRYIHHEITQSLNQYQYCYANPIRYVDPLGFDLGSSLEYLLSEENLNLNNWGSDDAIQMAIVGNVVMLNVFVDIRGDVDTMIYCPETSVSHNVVDLTIQGIEMWSRLHSGVFGQDIFLHVNVHPVGDAQSTTNQNNVIVNLTEGLGHARFYGRRNWNTTTPGTVEMYTRILDTAGDVHIKTFWEYRQVMAHEFVHVFGVGDAYGGIAGRQLRRDFIRPSADMFCEDQYNQEIAARGPWHEEMFFSHYTIQMMLLGIATGEWQNFMEYRAGFFSRMRRQSLGAMDHSISK